MARLQAIYHIRCDAKSIDARAQAIAVEQSVEMPLAAIDDKQVLSEIAGRVEGIRELGPGLFEARISLSAATVGRDAGQLVNMLFGNTSIHDDVVLHDAEIPDDVAAMFGGPRHGLDGLRKRVGAGKRALTCSAIKPQGLPPAKLAELARKFADGGIDYIKDDHGLADQAYSPFKDRVAAIAAALRGTGAHYVPSITGDLDAMRAQVARRARRRHRHRDGRADGRRRVELPPAGRRQSRTWRSSRIPRSRAPRASRRRSISAGCSACSAPTPSSSPTMAGASAIRRRPAGRSPRRRSTPRDGLRPCVPVPAGGMSRERVAEMLEFYGTDIMLLIGGGLLEARERLTEATAAFVAEVHGWPKRRHERRARSTARRPTTTAGTASTSSPTRRTAARCSRRSPGRPCSPTPT